MYIFNKGGLVVKNSEFRKGGWLARQMRIEGLGEMLKILQGGRMGGL